MSLFNFFEDRSSFFQQEYTKHKKNYNWLAIIRVVVFVFLTILIIFFANSRNFQLVFLTGFIFLILFGLLVNIHNKVADKKELNLTLFNINQEEIKRLNHQLNNFDDGARFIEKEHPFIVDLDIFGPHSIYQLLNRCTTQRGKDLLANKLKNAANTTSQATVQESIKELTPLLDWRQRLQAQAYHSDNLSEDLSALGEWLKMPVKHLHKKWIYPFIYIAPLFVSVSFVMYLAGNIGYMLPFAGLLANILILSLNQEYALMMHKKVSRTYKIIQSYEQMIRMIEKHNFKSFLLDNYRQKLLNGNRKASESLKELKDILNRFDSRSNMFYLILNVFFLFDIFLLLKSERWKDRHKDDVFSWLSAANEVEVASSLAGFAFLNPDFTFSETSSNEYGLSAKDLGHPLIPNEKRVLNDFEFEGKGKIGLITGSNMSGKSTFLRTIGVNAVLGMIGAPVCASKFSSSSFKIFTSMRTTDSLSESVSSFYAELKRIKQLLEMVAEKEPVLFILDEILKGTNSHDRHKGAAALIKQLRSENCFGFISTHDLELGQVHDQQESIVNYSFNSTVEGEEILFDYKINNGICSSFNASKLMEQIGIKI